MNTLCCDINKPWCDADSLCYEADFDRQAVLFLKMVAACSMFFAAFIRQSRSGMVRRHY